MLLECCAKLSWVLKYSQFCAFCGHSPVVVWRIRVKIFRTLLCCIVCHSCAHEQCTGELGPVGVDFYCYQPTAASNVFSLLVVWSVSLFVYNIAEKVVDWFSWNPRDKSVKFYGWSAFRSRIFVHFFSAFWGPNCKVDNMHMMETSHWLKMRSHCFYSNLTLANQMCCRFIHINDDADCNIV